MNTNEITLTAIFTAFFAIANFAIGYFKTGKFDLNAALGLFMVFRGNVGIAKDRYSEQVKPTNDESAKSVINLEYKKPEFAKSIEKEVDRFSENKPYRKILNLKYNSQRDNSKSPNSACNVTSAQIALSFDYPETKDDDLWEICNSESMASRIKSKYPKDWSWISPYFTKKSANEVLVVLLESIHLTIGSEKYAKIDWSFNHDTLKKEINSGYGCPILGKFAGGGHFVCVVGYDDSKQAYIVHDPWGNWTKNYRGDGGLNGEFVEYPYSVFESVNVKCGILIHADKKSIA